MMLPNLRTNLTDTKAVELWKGSLHEKKKASQNKLKFPKKKKKKKKKKKIGNIWFYIFIF